MIIATQVSLSPSHGSVGGSWYAVDSLCILHRPCQSVTRPHAVPGRLPMRLPGSLCISRRQLEMYVAVVEAVFAAFGTKLAKLGRVSALEDSRVRVDIWWSHDDEDVRVLRRPCLRIYLDNRVNSKPSKHHSQRRLKLAHLGHDLSR